ncbi:TetR/AcrR family transcriptional regulator [Streptacidiphilus griseoplanus]|uniref:TetR/AcrR family transcriptional regulator n=1 Tax=Peterkaempfera griseoplana TaxID=66896 RepID=UPI0006E1BF63|nr:TetR/AcrR family transcriptional regulator [Peterkaempfera griseoplana]
MRTRERVLDAAAEEFAAQGYAATALHAVAVRAGVTKGALYAHFSSKEELARAVVREGGRLPPVAGGAGPVDDPVAELRSLVLHLTSTLQGDARTRAAYRLVAEGAPVEASAWRVLREAERRAADLVGRAVAAGTASPQSPPGTVARLLLAAVLGAHAAALLPEGAGFTLDLTRAWHPLAHILRVDDPRDPSALDR